MLIEQDRAGFSGHGVVVLRGAFGREDAARMRRRVRARLAAAGVTEDGPSTLGDSTGHRAEQGDQARRGSHSGRLPRLAHS